MAKYTVFGRDVDIDIPKSAFPSDAEFAEREKLFPCEHDWMTSLTKKATLHYRAFLPSNNKINGVVCFHHGIQGQSGRGFVLPDGRKVAIAWLAEKLTQHGYALYALDEYGHGLSEGTRFFIEKWEDNVGDFENFAKLVADKHPQTPLFLMGESYGGCLTLHVAGRWEDKTRAPSTFKGIILVAPAIIGDMPPAPIVFTLKYGLAPFFPRWSPFFMPNTVPAERIWSDPEVRAHFTQPRFKEMCLEGCGRAFRLGTAVQLLGAVEAVRTKVVPKLTAPFCVAHGTKDESVLMTGTEFLVEKAQTPEADRAVLLQDGAFHDLFSEPQADQVLEFMLGFLNKWSSK